MDQSAFRNLLATQAVKQGTGRAAGVLGTHAAKRKAGKAKGSTSYNFGKPQGEDKTKEGGKDAGAEESATAFAPRKAKKGGKPREEDGEEKPYHNRAEMRRTGKEDEMTNEFKEAEKLAEEFEKRARAEGQDEATIEEQRKYLGGDATHSILVKGLDYALLAARKAEIEATEGKKAEDELDALLEGGLAESAAGPINDHKEKGVGRKRTREEIVQQLKRQKTGASADTASDVLPPQPQQTLGSKFKSIAQKKREAEEAQALAQGKKKLKKKKKVVPSTASTVTAPAEIAKSDVTNSLHAAAKSTEDQPATQPTDPTVVSKSPDVTKPVQVEATSISLKSSSKTSRPIPGVTPVPDEDEDDIFGGVGEYTGAVASDSDSDAESVADQKTTATKEGRRSDRRRSHSRSRSRSRSHDRDDRGYARQDGRSRDQRYARSHSRERYRDSYDERDRYGNSSSRARPRPRSRSPDYPPDRYYERDGRGDRGGRYDSYIRGSDRPRYDSRDRYDRDDYRPSRSREAQRGPSRGDGYRDSQRGDQYRRQQSRSPSPARSARGRSDSPRKQAQSPRTAPPKAPTPQRMPSRSPSPVDIDALRALSRSPSFSDADADPYAGPVRPGQSLRALGFGSSDVPSAKELLEMDALANESAQKRSNKAKWRRAQGLAPQEGDQEEDGVERNKHGKELTDAQKERRDQQRLQNFMDKKEKGPK
ncbi:hypothetical protein QFC22_002978 [Naganishia vaughanmartiniae]|uniref:Uncharacterized protein n=1 Tax=Naganishia vaughanmartiniae TaxID=1424756 RepID=A0ACC2X912_9TREE|nr:hypothetical protein QFC22_002978 [Naganishia vaughanmartiniae]